MNRNTSPQRRNHERYTALQREKNAYHKLRQLALAKVRLTRLFRARRALQEVIRVEQGGSISRSRQLQQRQRQLTRAIERLENQIQDLTAAVARYVQRRDKSGATQQPVGAAQRGGSEAQREGQLRRVREKSPQRRETPTARSAK